MMTKWAFCFGLAIAYPAYGQRLMHRAAAPQRPTETRQVADKTTTWTNGGGDQDLDNAANWSNGKPDAVSDWFIIFNGDVSNTAPTSNLNKPETDTWSIKKWQFLPSYTAGIGSSGTPLCLYIDSTASPSGSVLNYNCTIRGRGAYYLDAADQFTDFVVNVPNDGSSTVTLQDTIRNLYLLSGDVTCSGASQCTGLLYMEGGTCDIVRGAQTTAFHTAVLRGGTLTTNRDTTSTSGDYIVLAGANVEWSGLLVDPLVVILDSGVLTYIPTSDPSAEHPDLITGGGFLDISKSRWALDLTTYVIGPYARVEGETGISDLFAGMSAVIDLRQPLP